MTLLDSSERSRAIIVLVQMTPPLLIYHCTCTNDATISNIDDPAYKILLRTFVSHTNEAMAQPRGRSRISGKGVHMFKGVGARFPDFILFFLNIP